MAGVEPVAPRLGLRDRSGVGANRTIRASRARVLGGCSSHNAAAAYRAPDEDLRPWGRLGATGWTPETCRTYFDRVFAKTGLEWAPGLRQGESGNHKKGVLSNPVCTREPSGSRGSTQGDVASTRRPAVPRCARSRGRPPPPLKRTAHHLSIRLHILPVRRPWKPGSALSSKGGAPHTD